MRKKLMLILAAAALTPWAVAQNTTQNPAADTPGERNLPDSINIIGTPSVNPGRDSATITWKTNKEAASDVVASDGLAADKGYGNISVLKEPAAAFSTPEKVDLVFTAQNYHDYPDKFMGKVDPVAFDKQGRLVPPELAVPLAAYTGKKPDPARFAGPPTWAQTCTIDPSRYRCRR